MNNAQLFNKVCGRFAHELDLIVSSEDELAAFAVERLAPEERSVLKTVLGVLLSEKYSDDQFLDI